MGVYQLYEESATDLGQLLTQKDTSASRRASMSKDVAKALGKISGGLYLVTGAHSTAKSAMIASWVSQASFEPPGITIAVAKDRAIEAFMQVDDTFVLNCLREDNYQELMKHFLKRFPPGADRFLTTIIHSPVLIQRKTRHMRSILLYFQHVVVVVGQPVTPNSPPVAPTTPSSFHKASLQDQHRRQDHLQNAQPHSAA